MKPLLLFLCLVLCSLAVATATTATTAPVMIRSAEELLARVNRGSQQCEDLFEEVCPIGCNGRIGENALSLDKCGVCGGDGSSCKDDDDGSCDSTCIALVVGIPLAVVLLLVVVCSIIFFAGAAERRRRRRSRGGGTTTRTNAQYLPTHTLYQHPNNNTHINPHSVPIHGRHRKYGSRRRKKAVSEIRWTNGVPQGWGKGEKYY